MKEQNNLKKFFEEIISHSNAKKWEEARKEWVLYNTYNDLDTCICGHNPIKEICEMRNVDNGTIVIVGNVCVNKFFGITTSEKIFKSIRKIKKDINKPVNIETIDFLSEKKKLKESDINFYRNTHLKKKKELSGAQLKWRVDVNNRILNTFKKSV